MKTSLPMDPYLRWVRIHAQKLGMPYEVVLPIIVEVADEEGVPPTILHPYMPTDIGGIEEVLDAAERRAGYLPRKVSRARAEDLEVDKAAGERADPQ